MFTKLIPWRLTSQYTCSLENEQTLDLHNYLSLTIKRVKKTRIKVNSYARLKHKIFVFSFQCYRLVISHGSLGSFDITSNAWTHQSRWENKQTWTKCYMLSFFKWTPTSFESVRYFCSSAKKFFFSEHVSLAVWRMEI